MRAKDPRRRRTCGPIPIQVLAAQDARSGRPPLVVFIHGGGWWMSIDAYSRDARGTPVGAGAVVVWWNTGWHPEHPARRRHRRPDAPVDGRTPTRRSSTTTSSRRSTSISARYRHEQACQPATTLAPASAPPCRFPLGVHRHADQPLRDDGARYADLLSAPRCRGAVQRADTLFMASSASPLVFTAAEATDVGLAALKRFIADRRRQCSTRPHYDKWNRSAGARSRQRMKMSLRLLNEAPPEPGCVVQRGGGDHALLRLDRRPGARLRRRFARSAFHPAEDRAARGQNPMFEVRVQRLVDATVPASRPSA